MILPTHCESCETAFATIQHPADENEPPFEVCEGCHVRLISRALRPLEWFNLAKHHGWTTYLLHDDFYDQLGTALQPEFKVEKDPSLRAPGLADVSGDPALLLDYTVTRWSWDGDLRAAWRKLPPHETLKAVEQRTRISCSRAVRDAYMEVVALCVGGDAAEFVRAAWQDPTPDLSGLVMASAACLPSSEAFERTVGALAVLEGSKRTEALSVLVYFRSPMSLDWIETNYSPPHSDNWVQVAAASQLDWPRVEAWLSGGRPLSLVALDALSVIADPRSPLLREIAPTLNSPPARDTFERVLRAYAERDPVPRVTRLVNKLLTK